MKNLLSVEVMGCRDLEDRSIMESLLWPSVIESNETMAWSSGPR